MATVFTYASKHMVLHRNHGNIIKPEHVADGTQYHLNAYTLTIMNNQQINNHGVIPGA